METKYVCKYCKKEFKQEDKQIYCAHAGHCKRKALGIWKDFFKDKRKGMKGLTKENNIKIANAAKKNSIRLKKLGKRNPYFNWRKDKVKDAKARQKQSTTLKFQYRTGIRKQFSTGRGKRSFMIYNNNKYMFRSTWEFFFALYLVIRKVAFDYENIRVQHNGHTRISDFEVNKKLYEIRGAVESNDKKGEEKKKAFENAGFKIRLVYGHTMRAIFRYLEKKGEDVKQLYEEIKKGDKIKQYFCFNADSLEQTNIDLKQRNIEIEKQKEERHNFKELERQVKMRKKQQNKISKIKIQEEEKRNILENRKQQLQLIDKTKRGWIKQLCILWNVSHTEVRRYIIKNNLAEVEELADSENLKFSGKTKTVRVQIPSSAFVL